MQRCLLALHGGGERRYHHARPLDRLALRLQSVTLMFVTGEAGNGSVDLELKTVRSVL